MEYSRKLELVPLWHRSAMTLEEAIAYSGLGRDTLVELANKPDCEIVIWCGNKKLFKRRKLEEYVARAYSL